jgi:sugar transferase (PEP-CTERM/EpsH1 system associated)
MAKVLFLAHRAPFPPDKGDKIRAFHILEHLAVRHQVWLGAGVDDPADLHHLPAAGLRYEDACFAPLGPIRRAGNMAAAALTGRPLSVARFRHPLLERWTDRVLREVRPDVVFVYSSALAQYVVGRLPAESRLIVDFVDADAEKWRAYARRARPPMRWVYAAEARRLIRFERQVLAAASAGVLVSDTERRLLGGLLPEGAGKLQVIPNGVDTDYFRPTPASLSGANIVFCGRMDYAANVDGAEWFARQVLPLVRRERPDATFQIVGAAPAAGVRALALLPGVEVTGTVADVRPYLARAAVVVAPLRIARGIQNKVLEGMAAGRPVVATPEALDGIDAQPGRQILVGAGETGFAEAVTDVLAGRAPADIGARGRDFVLRRHQWAAQLEALDRLIGDAPIVSAQTAA